ncbi:hypothetical protein KAR91_07565 [Candidatus Pacearchaeota archaeon]|nr:hypothetical protein [Candidatus Pacearchaeota archaeon]
MGIERLEELSGGGKITPEGMQVILLEEISSRLGDLDDRLQTIERLIRFKTLTRPTVKNFREPRQMKNVPVGERVQVWELNVPDSMIAIIDRVANDWQKDFIAEWFVDGDCPADRKIERRLGTFANPLKMEPALFAETSIEWFYTNNSPTDKEMSVAVDGRLIMKDDLLNLLKD